MADDLRNYKLQLQQVEAALLSDETNEELIKLKSDLEEVINLTQDLLKKQEADVPEGSSSSDFAFGLEERLQSAPRSSSKKKKWSVGDKCQAKWEQNGQMYEATVEELNGDSAIVVFAGYETREICLLANMKDMQPGAKRLLGQDDKLGKTHSREYLKKKKQKKIQRFKQIEEERETEKNKWLSFSAKSTKKSGGKIKSIFASPENVNGRVGIGTCGISGRPMTEFSHGEKWRKGV